MRKRISRSLVVTGAAEDDGHGVDDSHDGEVAAVVVMLSPRKQVLFLFAAMALLPRAVGMVSMAHGRNVADEAEPLVVLLMKLPLLLITLMTMMRR